MKYVVRVTSVTVAIAGAIVASGISATAQSQGTAVLTNAAGDDSGCVAQAVPARVIGPDERPRVRGAVRVRCSVQWGQLRDRLHIFEVTSDGDLEPIFPAPASSLVRPGPEPGDWSALATIFSCQEVPGTRELLVRGFAVVSTGRGDPDPYRARVETRATITCPG